MVSTVSKSMLIVISAPSGCGKTTIAREILRRHPEMIFSVSATTRKRRDGEVDGKDYFFLSQEEFEKRIRDGQLAEWEMIYGDYYGSLRNQIESALRSGTSMVFDIDVNGSLSIKKIYPDDAILIFIRPPSMDILTTRLQNRRTESEESIQRRLERVPMEMEKRSQFHFQVVNDSLERAVAEVESIIEHAIHPSA